MNDFSSSFACFFCCARSGRSGRERLNGDDTRRLLRYGRRPRDRPEEGVSDQSNRWMGAALPADRRRSVRRGEVMPPREGEQPRVSRERIRGPGLTASINPKGKEQLVAVQIVDWMTSWRAPRSLGLLRTARYADVPH